MKRKAKVAAILAGVCVLGTLIAPEIKASDSIRYEGNAGAFVTETSGNIQNGFSNMEPGESRKLTMKLYNDSSEEMRFYMNAAILDGRNIAEEGNQEAVYDFSIESEGVIFFQAVIGGEMVQNISVGKEYLTEDYHILLDTLKKGEQAALTMSLTLDGDSMGNDYQNREGEIQLVFSAETSEPGSEGIVKKVVQYVDRVSGKKEGVQTGDESLLVLAAVGFFGAAAFLIVIKKKRGSREEEQ